MKAKKALTLADELRAAACYCPATSGECSACRAAAALEELERTAEAMRNAAYFYPEDPEYRAKLRASAHARDEHATTIARLYA